MSIMRRAVREGDRVMGVLGLDAEDEVVVVFVRSVRRGCTGGEVGVGGWVRS